MAIRLLIGAFLAAIVMFLWGWGFWTVLAVRLGDMRSVDPDAFKAMFSHEAENGEYLYPMPQGLGATEDDRKAFVENHKKGPLIEISYRNEGADPMDPLYFGIGFVHLLCLGIIAGFLLIMALKNLPNYLSRAGFVFLLGVFAAALIDVGSVVWMLHPWRYPAMLAIFHASSWLLAGLVLGAVIRQPREV
jgi:hypothetical protein